MVRECFDCPKDIWLYFLVFYFQIWILFCPQWKEKNGSTEIVKLPVFLTTTTMDIMKYQNFRKSRRAPIRFIFTFFWFGAHSGEVLEPNHRSQNIYIQKLSGFLCKWPLIIQGMQTLSKEWQVTGLSKKFIKKQMRKQ